MKISKLFHWLYAILMLLPFLVFIPNAFYYGFNEHAVAQEKTEQVPVYYESNDVNTYQDLVVGNIYYWTDNFQGIGQQSSDITYFYIKYTDNLIDLNIPDTASNIRFFSNSSGGVYLYYNNNGQGNFYNVLNKPFYFVIDRFSNSIQYTDLIISYIEKYEGVNIPTGEYQPLTTSMSITDSLSYAWDSVWQNDLFSWSYGSFLTDPFIYIGNVFNVPVDNSLYYALSYWLDISIIWLCFDVIMYVPLLVHRWLDKGIVE